MPEDVFTDEELQALTNARRRSGRRAVIVQTGETADTSAARQYPKTPEQMAHIDQALCRNALFSSLEREHRQRVALYMRPEVFESGSAIITQGDRGETFYVLQSGSVDIFKKQADGSQKFLVTVDSEHAGSFGELAAMYSAPRAASVIARERCDVWAIDGPLFRSVLREAVQARRKQYLAFIERVPALQQLTEDDRFHLADALVPEEYVRGAVIVRQCDMGDKFYFIVSGRVSVRRVQGAQTAEDAENAGWGTELAILGANDWFGEGALLSATSTRNATCIALDDCKLAVLDRSSFNRLLSGISEELRAGRE